jgi:hypothetical protein
MGGFRKPSYWPHCTYVYAGLCPMSSGTELSAVVFGQHVHPILILVIFFLWGCSKDKVYNSNPRTEEDLKENIHRDIANIPAEQLQKVNQSLFRRCEECLRVKGQQFQHNLRSVNCNYFIPNVIGQLAY